jgi:hypothetical protein
MRNWCAVHADSESVKIIRKVYDAGYEMFEGSSVPDLVVLCGEYQYRAAFCADHEVHLAAFLTQVMQSCTVKK